MNQLIPQIAEFRADTPYAYLVTPNVDHLVRLHKKESAAPGLAEIYRQAQFLHL